MKRALSSLALVASLCTVLACGGGAGNDSPGATATAAVTAPEESPTGAATPARLAASIAQVELAKDGTPSGGRVMLSAASEPGVRTVWVSVHVSREGASLGAVTFIAQRGTWTEIPAIPHLRAAAAGEYEAAFAVVPGDDKKTVRFMVTGSNPTLASNAGLASDFAGAVLALGVPYVKGFEKGLPADPKEWRVESLAAIAKTSFTPQEASGIRLYFNSDVTLAGRETVTWKRNGKELGPPQMPVPEGGKLWAADFGHPPAPGDYEAVLAGHGGSRTLKFQVQPTAGDPGKLQAVGVVAKDAEGLVKSKALPAARELSGSLDAWAPVTVVFSVAGAADAMAFECVVTLAGTAVSRGAPRAVGSTGYAFELGAGRKGPLPPGSYEYAVTNLATGEVAPGAFTVTDANPRSPTPAPTAGTISAIDQLATIEAASRTPTRTPTPRP
ncbi:MAG: hypothetical protein HS107_07645 [Thermoflexaceae bacterium]|nr:hypothetical protein [Thermoflexaceae bacterium]